MEALAAQRVAEQDPGIPVALPWLVPGRDPSDGPAAYRATIRGHAGTHHARLYDRLPGRTVPGATLGDDAIRDWGTMAAGSGGRCGASGTRRRPG